MWQKDEMSTCYLKKGINRIFWLRDTAYVQMLKNLVSVKENERKCTKTSLCSFVYIKSSLLFVIHYFYAWCPLLPYIWDLLFINFGQFMLKSNQIFIIRPSLFLSLMSSNSTHPAHTAPVCQFDATLCNLVRINFNEKIHPLNWSLGNCVRIFLIDCFAKRSSPLRIVSSLANGPE